MENTKKMKEKLEKAESKEEIRTISENAGINLSDEDLDQVAGGQRERRCHQRKGVFSSSYFIFRSQLTGS